MQNAMSVALEAEALAAQGKLVSAQELEAFYLRPPQADPLKKKPGADSITSSIFYIEENRIMGKVVIMDHPLVAHKLTIMRDKNTSVKDFRELVSEIGMLITYEATRDLPMTTKHIETPICEMEAPTLAGKQVRSRPHPAGRSGSGGRRSAHGPLRPCGPHRYVPGRGDAGAPSSTSAKCPRTLPSATS